MSTYFMRKIFCGIFGKDSIIEIFLSEIFFGEDFFGEDFISENFLSEIFLSEIFFGEDNLFLTGGCASRDNGVES